MSKITLNNVCTLSNTPMFTPYGYVVTEDGMIYSLTERSCHGVVLALIFPEFAKEKGYDAPDEYFDVFHYQRFELDHSRETTAIRVSISMLDGELNFSKGETLASEKQIEAILLIIKEYGLKMNDFVQSDLSPHTVMTFVKKLRSGEI